MNYIHDIRIGCWGVLVLLSASWAQNAPVAAPAAPVPTQITAAKRVFIANMGTDTMSAAAFKKEHAENKPYDEFYAAVKIWGRYELVDTPSEAELIYEIGFSAPIVGTDKLTTYGPQLNRSIVDAKTHFRLWTLCEPVGGAFRKVTWDENFADGMSRLMNDLKKISTREDTVAGSTSK